MRGWSESRSSVGPDCHGGFQLLGGGMIKLPVIRKEGPMTSDQIAARARIDARFRVAARVGDMGEMQRCVAEDMRVLQSAYGLHLAGEPDIKGN